MDNRFWRRTRFMLLVGGLIAGFLPSAWAEESVRLGVFPYVTPVQLVKFHNPLRVYLEKTLGHPVTLETAPSFKAFIKRTRAGEYDYVLTAPHLGRLAQQRDGYFPLVKTGHLVKGVYLVPKDSAIQDLTGLAGKSITMVGQAAILSQMAVRQLRSLGFEDGVNIEIRYTGTHNNAMYAALRGESDVSVTGILLYNKIQLRDREKARVIGETPSVPGFIFLASSRVPENERQKVREALLSYGDTPEGVDYFKPTGFKALLPIDPSEMDGLQPYIERFLSQ